MGLFVIREGPHPPTLGMYSGMQWPHFCYKLGSCIVEPGLGPTRALGAQQRVAVAVYLYFRPNFCLVMMTMTVTF